MPLALGMPSFPGDTVFASRPTCSMDRGDPYNLTELTLGSHAGTHIDPPRHFAPTGTPVDEIELDVLHGPCYLVEVAPSVKQIGPADLTPIPPGTRRVLFRTANSERWTRSLEFFSDYVSLGLAAAEALLVRGVRLVGIDSLSVESDPTGAFPVHRALLGRGTLILEGLLLAEVSAGPYELECLPLRLTGGDGAPARALLIDPE